MVDISSQLTVNSQLGFAGHILLNERAVGGIYKAVTVGVAYKDDGQLVAVLYSGVIAIGAAVSRYCDDLPHQLTVTDDAQGTGLVTGNRKQVALDRFCCHQRHGLDRRHRGFRCVPASRRRRIGGRTVGHVGYGHRELLTAPDRNRNIRACVPRHRYLSTSKINNRCRVRICNHSVIVCISSNIPEPVRRSMHANNNLSCTRSVCDSYTCVHINIALQANGKFVAVLQVNGKSIFSVFQLLTAQLDVLTIMLQAHGNCVKRVGDLDVNPICAAEIEGRVGNAHSHIIRQEALVCDVNGAIPMQDIYATVRLSNQRSITDTQHTVVVRICSQHAVVGNLCHTNKRHSNMTCVHNIYHTVCICIAHQDNDDFITVLEVCSKLVRVAGDMRGSQLTGADAIPEYTNGTRSITGHCKLVCAGLPAAIRLSIVCVGQVYDSDIERLGSFTNLKDIAISCIERVIDIGAIIVRRCQRLDFAVMRQRDGNFITDRRIGHPCVGAFLPVGRLNTYPVRRTVIVIDGQAERVRITGQIPVVDVVYTREVHGNFFGIIAVDVTVHVDVHSGLLHTRPNGKVILALPILGNTRGIRNIDDTVHISVASDSNGNLVAVPEVVIRELVDAVLIGTFKLNKELAADDADNAGAVMSNREAVLTELPLFGRRDNSIAVCIIRDSHVNVISIKDAKIGCDSHRCRSIGQLFDAFNLMRNIIEPAGKLVTTEVHNGKVVNIPRSDLFNRPCFVAANLSVKPDSISLSIEDDHDIIVGCQSHRLIHGHQLREGLHLIAILVQPRNERHAILFTGRKIAVLIVQITQANGKGLVRIGIIRNNHSSAVAVERDDWCQNGFKRMGRGHRKDFSQADNSAGRGILPAIQQIVVLRNAGQIAQLLQRLYAHSPAGAVVAVKDCAGAVAALRNHKGQDVRVFHGNRHRRRGRMVILRVGDIHLCLVERQVCAIFNHDFIGHVSRAAVEIRGLDGHAGGVEVLSRLILGLVRGCGDCDTGETAVAIQTDGHHSRCNLGACGQGVCLGRHPEIILKVSCPTSLYSRKGRTGHLAAAVNTGSEELGADILGVGHCVLSGAVPVYQRPAGRSRSRDVADNDIGPALIDNARSTHIISAVPIIVHSEGRRQRDLDCVIRLVSCKRRHAQHTYQRQHQNQKRGHMLFHGDITSFAV